MSSAICFNLDQSEILSSGNWLKCILIWHLIVYLDAFLFVYKLKDLNEFWFWSFCIESNLHPFPNKPWFLRVCNTSVFENSVGKGEIARNEQFLLFPQSFLPFWRTFCHFHQIQNCHLQTLSVWKGLKFVIWERVRIPFTIVSPVARLRSGCTMHWNL